MGNAGVCCAQSFADAPAAHTAPPADSARRRITVAAVARRAMALSSSTRRSPRRRIFRNGFDDSKWDEITVPGN